MCAVVLGHARENIALLIAGAVLIFPQHGDLAGRCPRDRRRLPDRA
jgi:hypothetical protein